jgi:hypothetical protein
MVKSSRPAKMLVLRSAQVNWKRHESDSGMRLLTGVVEVQDAASVGLAAVFCSDACVSTSSIFNSVIFWEMEC